LGAKRGRFLIFAQQEIKKRFHVKRIGLFGSFARGDEKETSDVDIMVEFEVPTFDNFMKLSFFLEDLFARRVELVTPDSLSPYIASYVKKEVVWADQR
jgi:predicted nucleotidyltransferase